MTVRTEAGQVVLECDDCGLEQVNTTIDDMLINAQTARWKVYNHPDHGVQHYCASCGAKPEHELAMLMRGGLSFNINERGSSDSTGLLDNIVVGAAQARAGRGLPDMEVVQRKVAEDGEFSFGLELGDDEDEEPENDPANHAPGDD